MKKYSIGILTALVILLQFSCKKDFLEVSPDKSLIVPRELSEFQALLNIENMYRMTGIVEAGTDDYTVTYATWLAARVIIRNGYIWKPDIFEGVSLVEWSYPYQVVYYTNIVLDGLEKNRYAPNQADEVNRLRGTALFYRAFSFYVLLQTYAPPYVKDSASILLGVPLRLSPSPEQQTVRASLADCYGQVLADLNQALELLPQGVDPKYPQHPTQPAVLAMLARIYLSMNDYEKAGTYANNSLGRVNTLLDYNNIDRTPNGPLSAIDNPEVLYYVEHFNYGFFTAASCIVAPELYDSYHADDLRKEAFFRYSPATGTYYFKGSYTKSQYGVLFGGLATDELYLIRAECRARAGRTQEAMDDLNALLEKRWRRGSFTRVTATSAEDALVKVLAERRKELCFRGLRWADLRRLNKDPRFAKTLTRTLNGQFYSLPPNDPKYTYPIPEAEILLTGIPQNPR